MWDLPRPELEPVSPALAGKFSTTAPRGKPSRDFYALLGTVEPDCINITISNQSDPSVVTGFLDIKQHKINPAVLILAKGQSQIFRSP